LGRVRDYSLAVVIAQITDTHIRPEGVLAYGRVDTAPYLARAVQHLLGLTPRPDVVLATVDLVDAGSAAEYERLRALLAPLPMPVYLIPGNHDDRDALVAAFADHRYLPRGGRFIQYVVEDYPATSATTTGPTASPTAGRWCGKSLSRPASEATRPLP
jgi:3',5'-cyclic-AMP phosphodiesterase